MEKRGWWEENKHSRCQYAGLLIDAIGTMLAEGDSEGTAELYRWMESLGVNITDPELVYKWFGQRVEWGGVEATRLVQAFYRLALRNRV